jgi:N6-adenosine-specific RNA methylase IME4
MTGKYRTIVADPPWPICWHGGGNPARRRAPTRIGLGYPTLTVDAIAQLPISDIAAESSGLFLWVTAQMNREGAGVRVARAWGFTVVGEFVWDKGMRIAGAFPRSCHEIVLVGRRGSHRFASAWLPSVQRWPHAPRHRHSQKPPSFIDMVESTSPGPYVELFARPPFRAGWSTWGNESANTATLEVTA